MNKDFIGQAAHADSMAPPVATAAVPSSLYSSPRLPSEARSGRTRQHGSQTIGSILWLVCLQFFVIERIVRDAWTTPYSWSENYISDLGAVYCTNRAVGYVCSPLHDLMNASFLLQGLLIMAGAAFISPLFPDNRLRTAGLRLVGIAGPSLMVVGLVPEDVHYGIHFAGAAIHLVGGSLGMILLGLSMIDGKIRAECSRRTIVLLSVAAGLFALLANILLLSEQHLGWGNGGMERFAAYPFPIWLSAMGLWSLLAPSRIQVGSSASGMRAA